ncbi:MAG: hypothetical protein KDB23_25010 [Planctomycetales bacterium]|nr:hypothetical protein [Planctomycetales bacterium]
MLRMKNRLFPLWTLLIAFGLSFAAHPATIWSQEAAAPLDRADLELRVQRLVQLLEHQDRQQRDSAETQLIEMGDVVMPLLPTTDDNTAAETRERLIRVRRAIEQSAARSVLEPSHVTMEGTFTLTQILEQFEKQTGNHVVIFNADQQSGRSVSVEFQQMDFWQALDQTLDQAGMTTNSYTGQLRTLGVTPVDQGAVARFENASYSGIFRVNAAEVQAQRRLDVNNGGSLHIQLQVQWEPRVLPIVLRHEYADVQAVGDDGEVIASEMERGAADIPVQSTVAGLDVVLPLKLPSRSVKFLSSLKGKFVATLPGHEETFEFTSLDQARNVQQQKGGVQVTLDRIRKNGSVYEFVIRLLMLNKDQKFESHLDWAANNVFYLEDASGKKYDNANYENVLGTDTEVAYRYLLPLPGELKDYKLVYKSPAAIMVVPVEYELKNIPLP